VVRPLLAGMRSLGAATATGAVSGMTRHSARNAPLLLDTARRSVGSLVAGTEGLGDRALRVAFAITRLADALGAPGLQPGASPTDFPQEAPPAAAEAAAPDAGPAAEPPAAGPTGLNQSTRQAVQVGVATSLAIVVGELVSPSRWYWAVIAAFVVFAGTTSRGDVLSRGSQRVVGAIGGVIAGMGLALLVGDRFLPALILMFGCVFFALYLVKVSQALMAFWITAVLALLYGLIGQFSVETLVVRVEETAVGAAMGILGPDIGGRGASASPPLELARAMDDALGVLRLRAKPLDNPLPRRRGRSSFQRALRVLSGVDHYARRLARLSDTVVSPGWASTLRPAAEQVRANLDGLRLRLNHRDADRPIRSAEEQVDAAEAEAARTEDPAAGRRN